MTIRQAFLQQADLCAAFGSHFTARLCRLLAQRLEAGSAVAERILTWPGDPSGCADSVPLRLAGTLHALALTHPDGPLAACYPPRDIEVSDQALWQVITDAFLDFEGEVQRGLNLPPQTNEVRRSAILIAASNSIADHFGLPIILSELGASAGLNLFCNRFSLSLAGAHFGDPTSQVRLSPDWSGPRPPDIQPHVIGRAGCDLNPLDPAKDSIRLRSYIWPDQPERLRNTQAAIKIARRNPASIAREPADSWLKTRLANRFEGAVHMVYHTVAWQYFDAETRKSCTRALEHAGASATWDAPIAWFGMEATPSNDPGAELTLTLWPDGKSHSLGRADFHGRWINWTGLPAQ